jgi:signal peptidase I
MGSMASRSSTHPSDSDSDCDCDKHVAARRGDHVACCDAGGLLTVTGNAAQEPELCLCDKTSELTLDVTVAAGRIWVMAGRGSDSADLRGHLGDAGRGMVRLNDLIGRAGMIYWSPRGVAILPAADSWSGAPARRMGLSRR